MRPSAELTHSEQADTLFDFCFDLPAKFGTKRADKPAPEHSSKDYIHDGYGAMQVARLRPLDIDQWLQAHEKWNGGKRSRVQAVKRALNYAREAGLNTANPIKGYRVAKQNARVTYLTPEQEQATCDRASPAEGRAIECDRLAVKDDVRG